MQTHHEKTSHFIKPTTRSAWNLLKNKEFAKAEVSFNAILSTAPGNTRVLIGLALCYQEMGLFNTAVGTLKQIKDWETNKNALLALARCYQAIGQLEDAIFMLNRIPTEEQDSIVRLEIARCYEQMGEFDLAIDQFKQIKGWERDSIVLLNMARCYQLMPKKNTISSLLYSWHTDLIKFFPGNSAVFSAYCNFLCDTNHQNAEISIQKAFEQFPNEPEFWLIRSKFYNKQHRISDALNNLIILVQTFPDYELGYIDLIKQYLILNQIDNVHTCIQFCYAKFERNKTLFKQIKYLMDAKKLIKLWGVEFEYKLTKPKQVALSSSIDQSIIELLKNAFNDFYILGDAVHRLMGEKPLSNQIIHVIALSNQLNIPGFYPSVYVPQLYTAVINEIEINCHVLPEGFEHSSSIQTISAYFTIESIYCDQDGLIHDPSGLGLFDLKAKLLRPLKHANLSFTDNATSILKAIHYIIAGYTPTDELVDAIKHWSNPYPVNPDYLFLMTSKLLLQSPDQLSVIRVLNDFELLTKLFNLQLNPSCTEQDALNQLWNLINPPVFNPSPSFIQPIVNSPPTINYTPSPTVVYVNVIQPIVSPIHITLSSSPQVFFHSITSSSSNDSLNSLGWEGFNP